MINEKDTLRVYLEMERDTGEKIAIFRNLKVEEVMKNPEIIREVVKECENSIRWYNILKKMNDER